MSNDIYYSLCNLDSGRFELIEEVEVEQCHWFEEHEKLRVRFDNSHLESFDYIWLATGGNFDIDLVPLLSSLKKQYHIECVEGLPVLQEDLSWALDVPLYVMGALAQLQLKASYLNLVPAALQPHFRSASTSLSLSFSTASA